MGRAQVRDQPSVEELLASIREAIHEDGKGHTGRGMTAARPAASVERDAVEQDDLDGGRPAYLKRRAERSTGHSPQGPGVDSEVPGPRGSMRGLRVSLDHDTSGAGRVSTRSDDFLNLRQRMTTLVEEGKSEEVRRTVAASPRGGFTGILGGDVRLEEALARLSRAGRHPRGDDIARPPEPPVAPAPPRPSRQSEAASALRPSLRETADIEMQTSPDAAPLHHPEPQSHADVAHEHASDYAGEAIDYEEIRSGAWQDDEPSQQEDLPEQPIHEAAPVPGTAPYASAGSPKPQFGRRQAGTYPPGPAAGAKQLPPPMLKPESAEQAGSAFDRLADTILAQATNGERSIEDVTKELLRPMLKSWLDHNLPGVVERLVREEIERVARRGGR